MTLFERGARAEGASIRNFGMLWPMGQPRGEDRRLALASRARWTELSASGVCWLRPCGSMHVAVRDDELAVLEQFAALEPDGLQMLGPEDACALSPALRRDAVIGALYSETEANIDPPQAIAGLTAWLASEGVEMRHGCPIREVSEQLVVTSKGERIACETVVICSGADLESLLPELYLDSGIRRCKLQMMATVAQPAGWQLGPLLAGGLTLRHYPSFSACPGAARVAQRIAREQPELDRFGIHVLASQSQAGECLLGDSHEYDAAMSPFDKPEIEALILGELRRWLTLPSWELGRRWSGVYAKHPERGVVELEARPGVFSVTATGGSGMTMSFAYADRFVERLLGSAWPDPPESPHSQEPNA